MHLKELILKVNKSADELDFITTRKYIEQNISMLNEHKRYLQSNARELLDFLTDNYDGNLEPLTRKDMASLNAINTYASKFDLRSLKFVVKESSKLLLRKDAVQYLNSDARVILQGMGAMPDDSQQ